MASLSNPPSKCAIISCDPGNEIPTIAIGNDCGGYQQHKTNHKDKGK